MPHKQELQRKRRKYFGDGWRLMESVPVEERVVMVADLNGYVGWITMALKNTW